MGDLLFMILSTVAALYAAYLLTCCLYTVDYRGEPKDKVVFPRIVYGIAIIIAFIPLFNLLCVASFLSFLAIFGDDYRVKSWLFEKPKPKEKADDSKSAN